MTGSARNRSDGGIVRPRALGVLRCTLLNAVIHLERWDPSRTNSERCDPSSSFTDILRRHGVERNEGVAW
jgi:hypothetical protein